MVMIAGTSTSLIFDICDFVSKENCFFFSGTLRRSKFENVPVTYMTLCFIILNFMWISEGWNGTKKLSFPYMTITWVQETILNDWKFTLMTESTRSKILEQKALINNYSVELREMEARFKRRRRRSRIVCFRFLHLTRFQWQRNGFRLKYFVLLP